MKAKRYNITICKQTCKKCTNCNPYCQLSKLNIVANSTKSHYTTRDEYNEMLKDTILYYIDVDYDLDDIYCGDLEYIHDLAFAIGNGKSIDDFSVDCFISSGREQEQKERELLNGEKKRK